VKEANVLGFVACVTNYSSEEGWKILLALSELGVKVGVRKEDSMGMGVRVYPSDNNQAIVPATHIENS
jgi:hypothetical protein